MKFVNDPTYKAFTETLRELRKSAGLTQTELAEMLNKDQTYVSKYESRERRLDFIEVRAICEVLGISIVQFEKIFEQNIKKQGS
jgi:transcriptional regulator with XRE-family HTH domain